MTNVGDVFEIKVAALSSKYLHLVAIDKCNLNSDVVVLYDSLDKVGGEDYVFYTHTTVSQGVHASANRQLNLSSERPINLSPSIPQLFWKVSLASTIRF